MLIAVCGQFYIHFQSRGADVGLQKFEKFNFDLPGWRMRELPIAETEFLLKKTEAILQYDRYRYVEYARGDRRIGLYIAYWGKGKVSPKDVSWHNPDICWVGNGWTRVDAHSGVQREVGGLTLSPTQERSYVSNSVPIYVMFWHLAGGGVREVTISGKDPWYAFLADMWMHGLDVRQEQLFIRLSANVPLGDIVADPSLIPLFRELGKLGIAKRG